MPIKQAAQGIVKKAEVASRILNMVEMAFRAYDRCHASAAHTLLGRVPLHVNIYKTQGTLY